MTNPKTFADVVIFCFEDTDLMREYRRLYGSTLGLVPKPRSSIAPAPAPPIQPGRTTPSRQRRS